MDYPEMKFIILLAFVLCSYGYYMGPGSTFRLGSFTCESANVSIGLEFESDELPINFITYAPDSNYGCVNINVEYPSLSVMNVQEFSGTLIGDQLAPLCYAFQNPSSSSSTNMMYYMNIICFNNSIVPPTQCNNNPYNISMTFNIIFVIIIVIGCVCIETKHRKNIQDPKLNASVQPVDIKL